MGFSRMRSWLRGVTHRDALAREVVEELQFHVERRTEDLVRSGVSPAEARRRAQLEFGSMERYREEGAEARGLLLFDELRRNVRHGMRALKRSPIFAAIAVLTLGLGIGANSAIFSFVNGLVLRPLPYPSADRLVWVATIGATSANLHVWQEGMRTLERVAGFHLHPAVHTGHGPAERLDGMIVTPDFFQLLGGAPVVGRLWTEAEQGADGPAAIVVRETFWRTLGFAQSDIGSATIVLDGETHTIVGVMPAEFEDLQYRSDVWYPAGRFNDARFNLIGLRRSDVSIAAVRAEAEALVERVVGGDLPEELRFANVNTLNDIFRGDVRTPLLVLFAAAGLVLLIACANVANLLLARAAGRQREMTVRAALGASRGTLLRQLFTESAVLGVAGALVGLAIAVGALRGAGALVPEHYGMGRVRLVRMDYAVLGFTLATGLAVTFLAGLAPAVLTARRVNRAAAVSARMTASRASGRFREMLVAAEIALALVLLIGTMLLIRTFLVLRPVSPGFEPDERLIASVALSENADRSDAELIEFARRLEGALESGLPGVGVALASEVPLSGLIGRVPVTDVDGVPVGDDRSRGNLDIVSATPDYLRIVGMRLVRGRALAEGDRPGSMPVALVNETAAQRFWPDAEAIGRRIAFRLRDRTVEVVVVGVVRDTRSVGTHTRTFATTFVSMSQLPLDRFHLVLHHPGAPPPTAEAVRAIVASVDPRVPVRDIQPMRRMLERAVTVPRYHTVVMSTFGALAVVLAAIGCYGVLSYTVVQRTREIGVRVALGASRTRIVRSVVTRAAALAAAGIAAGTALALALTRLLESTLYGVAPTDPLSFGLAAAALALVSLLAAYLPARRAAAIHPIAALNTE